jgi:hypothetical protein
MTENWYVPLSEKDDSKATAGDEPAPETATATATATATGSVDGVHNNDEDESELVMDGCEVDAFFEAINS